MPSPAQAGTHADARTISIVSHRADAAGPKRDTLLRTTIAGERIPRFRGDDTIAS